MVKRGNIRYVRANSRQPLTDDEVYTMVMLHQRQRMPVERFARRYALPASRFATFSGADPVVVDVVSPVFA